MLQNNNGHKPLRVYALFLIHSSRLDIIQNRSNFETEQSYCPPINVRSLFLKIQDLSEQASIESGTSYEEYIRLFTLYFERSFRRKSAEAFRIAEEFGYDVSMRWGVMAQGPNRRRR